MKEKRLLVVAVTLSMIAAAAYGQISRKSIPLNDAVDRALEKTSLTGKNAEPFHIRVSISEPENPQSPYQGTIEEWWLSPSEWRREVTSKDGMHQTIVVAGDKRTERDEGDYFPLWLRSFVTAVFDPVPDAAVWNTSGATIDQITLPNGQKSDACASLKSKIGSGNRATDAFSNVCFDGEGKLTSIVSPRYSMEFADYRGFHKIDVARTLTDDPEPGTKLVGRIVLLEDEKNGADTASLFLPLSTNDDRFNSIAVSPLQMEQLSEENAPVTWPAVRSGNLRGRLAMYISADAQGRVREAWPLNSDNAGLEDPARDQVRHWKLKPAVDQAGHPVQVDGGMGFAFETKIDNPLPVLTGPDIEKVETGCNYHPVLPAGLLPSGKSFAIRVSVNEQGKNAGESFPGGVPWDVIQKADLRTMDCKFKPYLVNGRATYYFVDFVFTAP